MEERLKKLRVYVDSSAVGGAFNKRTAKETKPFWDAVQNGDIVVIVSDVLEKELQSAPQRAKDFYDDLPKSQVERVTSTVKSNELATQYIVEGIVDEISIDDCRHVALATIVNADVIVSWNLKHMVKRSDEYKRVNAKLGYPQINIQTPDEELP